MLYLKFYATYSLLIWTVSIFPALRGKSMQHILFYYGRCLIFLLSVKKPRFSILWASKVGSRKVPDIVGSISAGRRAWNLAINYKFDIFANIPHFSGFSILFGGFSIFGGCCFLFSGFSISFGFFLGIYSYRGGHSCFDKTYFSYKIPIAVRVENHLSMLNSPIFPQLFLMMY